MANYNLTQTGDEVQAYIDSIPVIDVTGTLSDSTITFGSNPYSQIAANYAADCSSIVRLTVGTAVYLLRVTQYDGTNYTAAEMSGAHNVVATIGSSSASATIDAGIDTTPTQGSNNLVTSGGVWEKTAIIDNNEDDIFSIEDDTEAKILSVTSEETKVGDVAIKTGGNESDFLVRRNGAWTPESVEIPPLPDITTSNSADVFTIEDDEETQAMSISKDGFALGLQKFNANTPQEGQFFIRRGNEYLTGMGNWAGKNIALYGDSVVAIGNGDFSRPYSIDNSTSWGVFVANFLGLSNYYGRGIGGQSYKWITGGGSVSWVTPNGVLINRLDNYNYDSWNALSTKVYPSGVTAEMIEGGTAITIRGCGCSWLRIKSMFPESIKDNIHAVVAMFHNDANSTFSDFSWIENNATDAEWAADSTYYTGGDYNITNTKGAIASMVMKLQKWMPNAVIILATPISGRGTTGQLNPDLKDETMQALADAVIDMGRVMAIPVIDVFATCGINGQNRTTFISDSIHPYTLAGNKAVARAITGGIINIMSNF